MSFTPINRLVVLPCIAEHYKACLMGPGPALYMGGRLAGEVLGCNVPPEQLDIWVPSERGWGSGLGGGSKKEVQKKETDGGERTRESVGQSDKGRRR